MTTGGADLVSEMPNPARVGEGTLRLPAPWPAPTWSCHIGERVLEKIICASSLRTNSDFEGHTSLSQYRGEKKYLPSPQGRCPTVDTISLGNDSENLSSGK